VTITAALLGGRAHERAGHARVHVHAHAQVVQAQVGQRTALAAAFATFVADEESRMEKGTSMSMKVICGLGLVTIAYEIMTPSFKG